MRECEKEEMQECRNAGMQECLNAIIPIRKL
jgi:hypothetical protein